MAIKKPIKKVSTRKHLARDQREAKQTRIILIVTVVVAVVVLGLILFGLINQTVIRPRTPIAQVGDEVIRVREFESYVQYTRVQMLNQSFQYFTFHQQFGEFGGNFLQLAQSLAMQLSQPVTLGRELLDEMIGNLIIREEAERRGITVSAEEIDQAIQAAFGFFPDGTPTPTVTATIQPSPTLSETQLALINTPTLTITEEQIEEIEDSQEDVDLVEEDNAEDAVIEPDDAEIEDLAPIVEPDLPATPEAMPTVTLTPTPYTTAIFGQNIRDFNNLYRIYNFDIDDLRSLFEVQLLRDKLLVEITSDLEATRTEVWARHILVETLDEAVEVLALLEEGEDFFTLAEMYSTDASNRERGGDLGWFDENTMVPEFTQAAFSLDVGEISEPVESMFGFHIIQGLGKREAQIPPIEFAQMQQTAFNNWLNEQIQTREDIVIYDHWDQFVPTTPEVPQQFLFELYRQ
jgi:peptidyl-prolyl cis-trans isomerase D